MSLFGTLLSKIFPSNHPAVAAQQGTSANAANNTAQASQQTMPGSASASQAGGASASQQAGGASSTQQGGTAQRAGGQQGATGQSTATAQQGAAAAPQVDVEQVLDRMAQQHGEKLNWRTSIVDLMKLVGMDSGLNARKELARELHYTGDTNDSAGMNVWLHKQVMTKLAENGGRVPSDLLH